MHGTGVWVKGLSCSLSHHASFLQETDVTVP